ncbi:glycosyltransferase family 2 protein [Phenylobacterium sp.]|uniref:glycosyltransferase family 2 protein n=1 Tax=Phenylobacterium sp. TaxID=1871053 RepID=UPI00289F660C|nr:glycosyltransferase family 2 protein [Phenylobacterium sp.]
MHVAVCIVAFRNVDDIVGCLGALAASSYRDFEVLICENGGQAAYEALQARLPAALPGGQPVRVVRAPHNLGYAGGVNVGLRETPSADAWWVLNPDTLPGPESLARLAARLAEGDCEAVGNTVYLPGGRVQSHGGRWRPWLARAVSIGHGTAHGGAVDKAQVEREQSYLNGASMMIGRRFLDAVGPMREDYFLYCEEVEWCLRGLQHGMRLGYAPGADVLHEAGTTTGSYDHIRSRPRTPIYLGERNKLLTARDRHPLKLPVAAAAALALLCLRFGRARAWRQLGYALQGWLAGLRGERGPPPWLDVS